MSSIFNLLPLIYPIFTCLDQDQPGPEYGSNLDSDPQHWYINVHMQHGNKTNMLTHLRPSAGRPEAADSDRYLLLPSCHHGRHRREPPPVYFSPSPAGDPAAGARGCHPARLDRRRGGCRRWKWPTCSRGPAAEYWWPDRTHWRPHRRWNRCVWGHPRAPERWAAEQ